MSHKQDVESIDHALVQLAYAESGGRFTALSSRRIKAAIRILRDVAKRERRRAPEGA